MKKTRLLGALGSAALLAGAMTLAASPAYADDFYVDDSELGEVEEDGQPYPTGWFQGIVNTDPPEAGDYETTLSGLQISGGLPFLLLNGVEATFTANPGTGLDEDSPDFVAPGITVSSGSATFQIPVFTDSAGTGFTTLYATADEIASDTWHTSRALGDFDPHDSATLAELVDELEDDYIILAFGFHADTDASIVSLEWAGDTYWFLPAAPTVTLSATSLTEAEFAETGVTATFTGFVPGESVDTGWDNGNSGDFLGTVDADEDGVVVVTLPPTLPVSADVTYTISATGEFGVTASGSFDVVAETLPATGGELNLWLLGGGLLLALGGAAAVVLARRSAAKS